MNRIEPYMIPDMVRVLCDVLDRAGYKSWLVGGSVRDLLMGRTPHDFDIATDATPEQIQKTFHHTIPTGIKHGTVTVCMSDWSHDRFEVTTLRADSTYSDSRHPDGVSFITNIYDDLARRDFTMNAMAYDIRNELVIDPYGGQEDINNNVIRAVGDPYLRFKEDGLRCLRAVRFSTQLGFRIEEETFVAILPCIESFRKVAMERVSSELYKMVDHVNSVHLAMGVTYLLESGIMDVIVPEFVDSIGCTQNLYHGFDVMDHVIAVVASLGKETKPNIALAALFHDIGKPATKTVHPKRGDAQFLGHETVSSDMTDIIMTRLKFSRELTDNVRHLIEHHLVMYESKWNNATIRRWVRRVGASNVDDLLDLYRADILGKGNAKIKQSVEPCEELRKRVRELGEDKPIVTHTRQLAITGHDIMGHLMIKPSKMVGDILNMCMDAVTEDPSLNEKEKLLAFVLDKVEIYKQDPGPA